MAATIHTGRELLQEKHDAAASKVRAEKRRDASNLLTAAVVTAGLYVLAYLLRKPLLALGNGVLGSLTIGSLPWSLIFFLPKLIIGAVVMLFPFVGPLVVGAIVLTSGDSPAREQRIRSLKANERILASGVEGEREALELVRLTSGNAHVFTNLIIPGQGHNSETDLIVVAESGVTVVEVKNHKGSISGFYTDEKLTQRSGGHAKTFYNPIRQVATHVRNLSQYLAEQGLPDAVQPAVLFIHPEARVGLLMQYWSKSGDKTPTPVYDYASRGQLLQALNTPQPAFRLTDEQISAIVAQLDELRVKGPRASETDEIDRLLNLVR